MKQLHPKTLEALADLVCGEQIGYRSAAVIARFLQQADRNFPDHDGRTRRNWVLELLDECNNAPGGGDPGGLDLTSLEAVILQLADPRQSGGDREAIQQVLTLLNRVLATEGLLVSLNGTTPRLQCVQEHVAATSTSGARYLIPDFQRLTSDPVIIRSLRSRWEEAQRCIGAQAHLATILLLGSILEGVLLVVIKANPADANRSDRSPKDGTGKPKLFQEWSLSAYIEVASDCGWIKGNRLRFSHALRESRNLIHPLLHTKIGEWPNEDSCRICWEVVNAAIADVLRHIASTKAN